MDIKMIAFDLDETLLRIDKTIPEDNIRAIQKAGELGIHVVVATGRPVSSIGYVLDAIPSIRYGILSNGGVVLDLVTGEYISEHTIPVDVAVRFLEYGEKMGYPGDFFVKGKRFVPSGWASLVDRMEVSEGTAKLMKSNCTEKDDLISFLKTFTAIEKVSIRFFTQSQRDACMEESGKLFPELEIATSLPNNLEATSAGVTKGTGLKNLCTYLGIDTNSVLAFGDNGNDIAMLKEAGIGVAMGNSEDYVKEAADRVTLDNEHAGVGYMIEEIFGWQHY